MPANNAGWDVGLLRRPNSPARIRFEAEDSTKDNAHHYHHDCIATEDDNRTSWDRLRRTISMTDNSVRFVNSTSKNCLLLHSNHKERWLVLFLLLGLVFCLSFIGVWLRTSYVSSPSGIAHPAIRAWKAELERETLQCRAAIPDSVRNPNTTIKSRPIKLLLFEENQHEPILMPSRQCVEQHDKIGDFCNTFHRKKCPLHTPEPIPLETIKEQSTSNHQKCKTLWFAGFSEGPGSRCPDATIETGSGGTGIRMQYAAALESARVHAKDVLQPVLLLGRYGLSEDEDVSAVRAYAEAQGAIVVTVDRLSFQDDIAAWHRELNIVSPDHQMGPYMRMDIPGIVEQHRLFDLPGICPRHVLYTDADSLFVNPVGHADMDALKAYMVHRKYPQAASSFWSGIWARFWSGVEPPFVMYGREKKLDSTKPKNTGVMLMDVPRFQQELPAMINFRNEHIDQTVFTAFDQDWFNLYFQQNSRVRSGRHLLPLYWNWKLYWRLEPSVFTDIKIVHFHGPKPQTGAWRMADCQFNLTEFWPPQYHGMIKDSICCDRGKTAARVREFYTRIAPANEDVC